MYKEERIDRIKNRSDYNAAETDLIIFLSSGAKD
jgi:hypothetical protein